MFSKSISRLFALLIICLSFKLIINIPASAISINQRSVVVSSAIPLAIASHSFQLTLPTASNVGSIVFEYCTSPLFPLACVAPADLDVSAAGLASQSGNTGFSIDSGNSTVNKLVLARPPVAGTMVPSNYVFNNITNPSTSGQTVFVRISTYSTTDGSGPYSDNGAVAFSIQSVFNVGAYIPPFLRLCVGLTVAPDCSSLSGNSIDLGTLSSTTANTGQSQFATATNDPSGYVVYALGTTMTSGNNIIPLLPNPTASFPGTGQFGINLRANLIPAVGQDPVGLGTGVPSANYNIPNRFVFNDGDSITSSSLSSDYNRMTVSYLVNVAGNQIPGIYSTTLTYVATVQF